MDKEELNLLKLEGYMQQQDKEYYLLRILTEVGNLNSDIIRFLSDIADLYGRGYIGVTTRQCIEIPWIKEELINEVKKQIEKMGIKTGGTGFRVVGVTACKGVLCKFGLIDSQEIAMRISNEFLGMNLPGKFKIGVTACPNSCVNASLSDLGFMAQNEPRVEEYMCKGCKVCARTCKVNAIEIIDKKAVINYDKCISCGQCIKVCPFKVLKLEKEGIAVYIGGKAGREIKVGYRLNRLYEAFELEELTEKIISYYKENAKNGERLGKTIERIGIGDIKRVLDIKNK